MAIFLAGLEVGLIFALKVRRPQLSAGQELSWQKANERNTHWPFTLMAVLSALLLAMGVGWHYVDIYRTRTVRGISFLFVGIDAAGDLFSLLSLGMFTSISHYLVEPVVRSDKS